MLPDLSGYCEYKYQRWCYLNEKCVASEQPDGVPQQKNANSITPDGWRCYSFEIQKSIYSVKICGLRDCCVKTVPGAGSLNLGHSG